MLIHAVLYTTRGIEEEGMLENVAVVARGKYSSRLARAEFRIVARAR